VLVCGRWKRIRVPRPNKTPRLWLRRKFIPARSFSLSLSLSFSLIGHGLISRARDISKRSAHVTEVVSSSRARKNLPSPNPYRNYRRQQRIEIASRTEQSSALYTPDDAASASKEYVSGLRHFRAPPRRRPDSDEEEEEGGRASRDKKRNKNATGRASEMVREDDSPRRVSRLSSSPPTLHTMSSLYPTVLLLARPITT